MLTLFEQNWLDVWGEQTSMEPVGSVFTRPEIVSLVLDLAGYRVEKGKRLAEHTVLEPGCGDGAFISAIVKRLLESECIRGTIEWDDSSLDRAICAVDINQGALAAARAEMCSLLLQAGCPGPRATALTSSWILHTDFLLHPWERRFDFIVGNPPYVRLEEMPPQVMMRYRALYDTLTDRADLYVAFFERGLKLLTDDGALAFICANRFAKNQYGRALRCLIAEQYRVRYWLNLEHTQPFLQDVAAYPAIIVLDRRHGQPTVAATLEDLSSRTLAILRNAPRARTFRAPLTRFTRWYSSGEPWLTTSDSEHSLLERFAQTLPTLEGSAPDVQVSIGVATGADRVFILPEFNPDIEEDRQLPLVLPGDMEPQEIRWSGHYVINPFAQDGTLVPLQKYPGLAAYLENHEQALRNRHVAKLRPHAWYRTIDRIWPDLVTRPKLLAPDIQRGGLVSLDLGRYYPHHNLYWIASRAWDLRALQAILRSSLVTLQVRAQAVQMRGGNLRYQAQALRRVRIPSLSTLSPALIHALVKVAASDDQAKLDSIVERAFEGADAL